MAFNILVADDSETMRAVVKKTVKMAGIPVGEYHEAVNGKEGLEILANHWIDVILSDINMPEMGGMEFLQEIKKNDDYKRIPVIFITTESSEARMEEAKKIGVSGYVRKPFKPEEIKTILYEVLEKAYDQKIEDMPSEDSGDNDEEMDF